jgi:hypothetical protein
VGKMDKKKNWIALFSQTGSEIYEVSRKLNRFPDVILTNQNIKGSKINEKLLKHLDVIVSTSKTPHVEEYEKYFDEYRHRRK